MKTINADIFEVFETYDKVLLATCCNCFHTMGGGIAKVIKDRYPKAYEADRRTSRGDINKLGTFSLAEVKDGKYIVNLYAQYTFGKNHFGDRELSYDALYNGLCNVFDISEQSNNVEKVLIPHGIGCGLARGRWEIVEKIIDVAANKYNVEVLICKL